MTAAPTSKSSLFASNALHPTYSHLRARGASRHPFGGEICCHARRSSVHGASLDELDARHLARLGVPAIALGSGALAAWLGFDVRSERAYAHVRATAPTGTAAPPTSSDRWPDGNVTYFNASPEHEWAVQQARGTRAARTPVSSPRDGRCGPTRDQERRAREVRRRPCDDRLHLGRSVVRLQAGHRRGLQPLRGRARARARVRAVLGLSHDDADCAIMNSSGDHRGSRRRGQ